VFISNIAQVSQPTSGSREFIFINPNAWGDSGWEEGQFITLKVEFRGKVVLRNYSIVRVDDSGITICIKLVNGGQMSQWAMEAKMGDRVEISLAVGSFTLPESVPNKLLFVAAGSGITPIISMLEGMAKRQHQADVRLIYANLSVGDTIYLDQIRQIMNQLDGDLVLYFEEDEVDFGKKGKLTLENCRDAVAEFPNDGHVYICGPEIVRKNLIQALNERLFPESNIHTESFLTSASVGKSGSFEFMELKAAENLSTYENESILDAILRRDLSVDFQCKSGACQSCVLYLQQGELINAKGKAIHSGSSFLSCQAYHPGKGAVKISNKSQPKSRNYWLRVACIIALLAISGFTFLNNGKFKMKGSYNTGHENLHCEDCHFEADGNLRQQVQHNVKTFLGMHENKNYVDVGHERVGNEACLTCHQRPNDRHPVSRFKEIRFAEQRRELGIHECRACHGEHTGTRMSILPSNYCKSCHENTEVKDDPLDIPHEELFNDNQWQTCLQCHDFHGNHIYKVPSQMKDTIPLLDVHLYLEGEKVIYSTRKHHKALK
jgi:ferredoxin-NADP reductase